MNINIAAAPTGGLFGAPPAAPGMYEQSRSSFALISYIPSYLHNITHGL